MNVKRRPKTQLTWHSLCVLTLPSHLARSELDSHSEPKVSWTLTNEHAADKRFQCKHCTFRSGNLAHLRTHEETHEDFKFQCKYCLKKLRHKHTLTAHERQHTGEKPFKCSFCENAFTSKSGLRQHMSGAHKVEGPKGGKRGWIHGRKQKWFIINIGVKLVCSERLQPKNAVNKIADLHDYSGTIYSDIQVTVLASNISNQNVYYSNKIIFCLFQKL